MSLEPALADRLAKLLRMICDRSMDGETLAAAGRLSAIAAAHDVCWDRALANGNGPALTEEQMRRIYDEGYQRGHADGQQQARPERDWTPAAGTSAHAGTDAPRIQAIIQASGPAIGISLLSEWEITFLTDIAARFRKYGARTYVSAKQWAVLDRIEAMMRQVGILE